MFIYKFSIIKKKVALEFTFSHDVPPPPPQKKTFLNVISTNMNHLTPKNQIPRLCAQLKNNQTLEH